jgi:GDP/UDP-N,N'-diacetylbacillosamine 2-epimerase (hydrolysing)
MKVGVLTSSRADYSIYYPLLLELQKDGFFELELIVFGTHLSRYHGYTVEQIERDGFRVAHKIDVRLTGDSPESVASAMGLTLSSFASFWASHTFDLVFALGDRYEMFAAVSASLPFGVPIAHIHGGETTLGAIDDALRHAITHMSRFHFATTDQYRERVVQLKASGTHVYNVGALSIDNLSRLTLLSLHEFKDTFGIDLSRPSVLITFHPETVSFTQNEQYISELIAALQALNNYQLIITMPNADTTGSMIRERLQAFIAASPNATGIESFGTLGYLSCIKYCLFMLGNTSSGFVEASYFPRRVINLGNRQQGRLQSAHITTVPVTKEAILGAVRQVESAAPLPLQRIYGEGNTAASIVRILKEEIAPYLKGR